MYVDVLSAALETGAGAPSGGALVDHAVSCRVQLLAASEGQADSAYDSLAAEAAYDRALIWLCREAGIATTVSNFAEPDSERRRLEAELADSAGIDLASLTRTHTACSGQAARTAATRRSVRRR